MSKNHYAVATMKKMKIDNLSGIFRHDFRETDNHKNQDIDPSKSNQIKILNWLPIINFVNVM